MGSFFKVPFIKLDENSEINNFLSNLKIKLPKIKIIGTTAHQKEKIYNIDMKTPILFLIGNETEGLNKYLIEQSDVLVTIPMADNSSASSLNVSQAASIMFYEVKRQRDKK
jgi:TrmH family RNA methyltransferase